MGANESVKTKDFRKVLIAWGLEKKNSEGSHESWSKKGMLRPVIFQSTLKEVPSHIFKNNLKTMGKSVKQFFDTLNNL